jgi:hypothetical protein
MRNRFIRALSAIVLAPLVLAGVETGTAHASGNTWYDRYVAMDAAVGDDVSDSRDGAVLAWDESYALSSFVDLYQVTGETRWLDRMVTHVDRVVGNADDVDRDGYRGWSTSRYSPRELLNSGFEAAAVGDSTMAANWVRWQTGTTNARRSTERVSGTYGLQIDSGGNLWRKVYQQLGTYEPNTVYDLTFHAKTNGSAAGGRVYLLDKTTNATLCSTSVTNTAWQEFSLACRTPAAAGHALQVWLGHNDYTVAGGRAYFDNVSISGRFPYIVHDGMVGAAIASFVRLAHQMPTLPALYHQKAAAYRTFLETEVVPRWESSGYIGNTWNTTVGAYVQPTRFDAYSHARPANGQLPYNISLGFARMLAILYQVNGNATYLDRARRIGLYFKSSLRLSGEAYVWPYASFASRMEDTSHANIDIGAARELHQIGQVFTATDMQRFANTLTQKAWNGSLTAPVVSQYVDGTGDASLSVYLVDWTEFAQWSKSIFTIVAEQYRNREVSNAYTMLALARIMKWDRSKLVNQSFELATSFDATQPAQWNRNGATAATAFRDTANAFDGRYGLTIRSVAGAAQQVYQTWEEWQPGAPYTVTFAGKAAGAAGGRVWIRNETTGAVLASLTFTDTGWAVHSTEFVAPAATTDVVRVYIGNADPLATGGAHIDTIKLRATGDTWSRSSPTAGSARTPWQR